MSARTDVSVYVVSAICGNWWTESGINSDVWENLQVGTWTDLLKGYGLGQWTNTDGNTHGRLWQLYDYMVGEGYDPSYFYGQLDYIPVENVWFRRQEAYKYGTLEGFLTSDSTDLTDLTHAWNIGWEGIHDASWDARVRQAYDVLDYLQNNYDPDYEYTPIIGNRYLSVIERYNNACCMFRYWNGGIPDPHPPYSHGKGFKWWIYMPPPLF